MSIENIQLSVVPRLDKQFKKVIETQLTQKIIKICYSSLNVEAGAYDYYNWGLIFNTISQCQATSLYIKRHFKSNILKDLLKVELPNLKYLNLSQNNIVSLQPLMIVRCPMLQTLVLSDNRIMSLRAFRKLPFKFKQLQICGNYIRNIEYIQYIDFKESVQINFDEYKQGPIILTNMMGIAKIKSKTIKEIKLNKPINQTALKAMLKMRQNPEDNQITVKQTQLLFAR